ncbi:MAG: phosphatidate cytidylyltransferase [Salinarimonadaceae bacterium]|nr:MAG: phosphatidate cytidylyltransferase [Salinarimonadaceae bacterium]
MDETPPPAETRSSARALLRSETGIRVLSAVVMVTVALAATWAGGPVFALFWLAAAIAVLFEWIAMVWIERRIPSVVAGGLALTTFVLAHLTGWPPVALVAVVVTGGALVVMISMTKRDRIWAGAGYAVAAVIVVVPIIVRDDPALGAFAILWIFAVVWGSDVAAYFTGRALGGPKLWPRVSPGKTWSGAVGGLAAAVVAGVCIGLVARLFGAGPAIGFGALAALSAMASVAGQIGDLAESALKRHFDVKDSSHLIPGHGGVMDRLDAFFAVCLLVGVMMLGAAPFGIGSGAP